MLSLFFLKPLKRGGEIGRDYLFFLSSIIKKSAFM